MFRTTESIHFADVVRRELPILGGLVRRQKPGLARCLGGKNDARTRSGRCSRFEGVRVRMIPDVLMNRASGAETRVFGVLQDVDLGEGWTAYHSITKY